MNLGNCPRCGKVFVRGIRDVCPACVREIDKQYEACAQYLRDNRGASITELSEATEVTIKQITKFIREGRISLVDAPNLAYPCESCGVLIQTNNLCDSCRKRLISGSKNLLQESEHKQHDAEQAAKEVYKGIKQYKDRT